MPKYGSLNEFLTENKKLQCNVRGCNRKRIGKSQYCGRHRARAYQWGHPEAGAVKPHLYSDEIAAVRALVEHNGEHEGIIYGCQWLDKMMAAGGRGADIRGAMYWGNLYGQEVSSKEILIRLGGLWLFDRRDELRRIIKNDDHLISLTGHCIVRFGKMHGIKYVPPKIYRQVGNQMKAGIGTLLVNLSHSTRRLEKHQKQIRTKLGSPLNVNF